MNDPRAGRFPVTSRHSTGRAGASRDGPDRASRRREYLDGLLKPSGVDLNDLASPTCRALHEYARFMLSLAGAQSASWNMAVVELCRAVEYEIVVTLRGCPGLNTLGQLPLGNKASVLRGLPPAAVAWLASRGYLAYVSKTLPNRLRALAQLRSASGAAHGGPEEREATRADHGPAIRIALTGPEAVIPSLARLRRASRQGR